ncbi:MAG: site-specific DNA-methyltransferase [Patescibacteria group bacterium]|nr:site-specific DNA-methyltransferase [Patescibacteria group bacterium]
MTRVEKIGDATLYLGDCREILPTLPKVDVVVTDPPYGISYVSAWRKRGPTDPIANDQDAPLDSVPLMASRLRDGGALYLATRYDVASQWNDAVIGSGLTMKTPIFWDKTNHTSGDLDGDFGGQVEIFIFAHQGRHKLRVRRGNLWRFPRDPASAHPTPKPVGLMERILFASTDAGATALDPFMGSGTTGVACANLGRKFIGIEIEPKYFDIACERIAAAYAQGRLFA